MWLEVCIFCLFKNFIPKTLSIITFYLATYTYKRYELEKQKVANVIGNIDSEEESEEESEEDSKEDSKEDSNVVDIDDAEDDNKRSARSQLPMLSIGQLC